MAHPVRPYEIVASTSGPPRAAPTPMSLAAGVVPKTTATNVTTLSGSAVPKAASTVPTAFWAIPSLRPTHSTPLTKNSQPT